MGSALETLCGQAYGAKEYHMLGIYTQRGMLILLVLSIFLAVIWFYTGNILIAFGQDEEISVEAGKFNRAMIPALFAYALLQCVNRFLQTQNIVLPMMMSSGITALFHILICWLLVFKTGFRSLGAALANAISYWINVIVLALYIKYSSNCSKTWTGFSKEALHDTLDFLKVAIPCAVMICFEYWSFEMVVLLSGLLPNPKLETSVLSISLNTCWMVYTISVGLGAAIRLVMPNSKTSVRMTSHSINITLKTSQEEGLSKVFGLYHFLCTIHLCCNCCSTRVSNELGAGNPKGARLALCIIVIVAISEGAIIGTITLLVRHVWGKLYSSEEEVIEYVAKMLPLLALSDFFDGFQCVLSGAARGCGWQNLCAIINLGAYYIVGIPSAVLFAFFFRIGGMGLWLGIICALVVQVVALITINLCVNWDTEARKAANRVQNSEMIE